MRCNTFSGIVSMGPDLELKGKSDVMDVSASKENGNVVREPVDKHITCTSNYEDNIVKMEASLYEQAEQANRVERLEVNTVKNGSSVREPVDKHISCASNYEDSIFELEASLVEQAEKANRVEHSEVNIVECTHPVDNPLVETESEDATESSSSFGNTASGDENDAMLSDPEVMSKLRGDEFGEVSRMRKKRLTPHWKTYIQSYTWHCKWVELQIRRFLSQALKYDLQLVENNQKKQLKSKDYTVEDLGAKSLPLSSHALREKVMKRKKRKRVEDTIDKAAYMAQHNLFSYFGNTRSSADVPSIGDDWANLGISMDKKINVNSVFGVSDEPITLEFRDDDNSMEQILWKIGVVESHVRKLKTRLNKVTIENAEQISSTDKLTLLVSCNALTASARNHASPPNNGDRMLVRSSCIASQLKPKYNMGDLVMAESAVSSHGEVTHLPDIIERTGQSQVGTSCKNSGDEHPINNRKAKEELNNFEEVKIQYREKLKVPKEEQESTIPSVPVLEELLADDRPNPKIRSVSKLSSSNNKRKRGRRKAGSGRWSRKSQGQPLL